jgi:enamine deaminase RidA (YjgF/YER057c/UK114 family)
MNRQRYTSSAPWESVVGYSRGLMVGPHIYISGTTATDAEGNVISDDPYIQTIQAIKKIELCLKHFKAELSHIVRTRIYVVDIDAWEDIGKAHGTIFQNIRPACTMVEVNRLILPEILVEIEADAYIGDV